MLKIIADMEIEPGGYRGKGVVDMADKKVSNRFKSRRSGILYLITTMVIVVFITFGMVNMLLFRSSQNRLIDNSVEKMIESEMENIASASEYIAGLLLPVFEEKISGVSTQELISALLNKQLTEGQRFIVDELKAMVESGVFELDAVFIVMPSSPLNPKALVIASSDETLIYDWEVPDYILEAIEEGRAYLFEKEGFPELGLTGPYAIITNSAASADSSVKAGYVFVKPMGEKVAAIEGFYDDERNTTNLYVWLTMIISILLVGLISFFVLSYLLRKRITEPIDELASEAEEVMQGNLDIEVKVHEGGEFEGLEHAFKEMVESIRKYIARSVGEE